jgi:hypothetical protein
MSRLFRQFGALAVTYNIAPDERHRANAYLYITRNRKYSIEDLSKPARRDARRALRSLKIGFADRETILAQGLPAFRDTRNRVGLSDGTREHFEARFGEFFRHPAHLAAGAWLDDKLLAFMTLEIYNDSLGIEGSFSCEEGRTLCPNNGLAHFVQEYFLVQHGFAAVNYGLSSLQIESDAAGLHSFKLRVGFNAEPVHRAVAVNPRLRLFVSRPTLSGVQGLLKVFPRSRVLKKAAGILAVALDLTAFHPSGSPPDASVAEPGESPRD